MCDSNNGITITPYSGYVNEASGTGKFTLDSIIFENVDDTCAGKDFEVQIWSNAGADALTASETKTSGTYTTTNSVRFYFQDSSTVVALDRSYIDYDVLTDTGAGSSEFANDQSSIQITFDPDRTLSFADATVIRRITIQTVKH